MAYSSEVSIASSSYRKYRAYVTAKISSSTNTTVTISYTYGVQMYYAYQYGVACNVYVNGAWQKSTSGYLTSNPGSNWVTVCSGSGTTTVSKSTSSFTVPVECNAWGETVSGYGSAGGSTSVSVSVTVPALTSYTVSYNANGGSGAPSSQTKYYGKTLTLSTTIPTRTGYKFSGWATSSTATSATYSAGGSYTANAAATLYAVWIAEKPFVITYNANGGSGAPSSQNKNIGVDITLSATVPTRTNYRFAGWSTNSAATFAPYKAGSTFTIDADVTLYAVWHTTIYDSYDLLIPTSSDVQDLWFQVDANTAIQDIYFRTS